jgi:hypothetical protein
MDMNMNMNEDDEKMWDLVDADELAEHDWEYVSRIKCFNDNRHNMNNLVLPLGRMCASNALMRSITIDASVNDSSREALDFENKSLGIIDDELTQLLRKWGLEDAVEALAKHGWNSVSRLKIFKRDEHMDELGLPSGTVCALEILLQSLVTNTLSAPPAALPVAAVTTADLQTVRPAAESAAALATPAVAPTAASAASLRTVAHGSTTAAIQAVAPSTTAADATTHRAVVAVHLPSDIASPFRIIVAVVNPLFHEVLKRYKAYDFEVKSSDTIVFLKARIEQRTGVLQREQRIFLDGNELMDDRTLGEFNLQINRRSLILYSTNN